MKLKYPQQMILIDREEAELLAERDLTDQEWQTIKEEIATDDNMWQVIDECIKNTVDAVVG
jgi:hypothetical protein